MDSRRVLFALVGALSFSVPSVLGCAGQGGWDPPPPTPKTPPPGTPPQSTPKVQPPAISGGTLLVMKDGSTAVAADSDRDRVWVVDLVNKSVLHEVKLEPGDEPGRVAEDADGRVHVITRRGGALVTIDPLAGQVLARRPVCPAPRGLAFDASQKALRVACADGRLFTFLPAGGAASSVWQLDGDLRDVIVQGSDLYVTRFRSAEILQVSPAGTIAQRITLPQMASMMPPMPTTFTPDVAWKAVAMPGGGIAVLHQRAQEEPLETTPGGYDSMGPCPGVGVVNSVVTVVQPGTAPPVAPPLGMVPLAVDVAVSSDGMQIAVASAGVGDGPGVTPGPVTGVGVFQASTLVPGSPCAVPGVLPAGPAQNTIAVAFDAQDNVIAQIREPAGILTGNGEIISLPGDSVANEGHATFHTVTQASIACASCHPEAGDDGRVWQFVGLGARRTQNIRGGVLARTPFHWGGDIADMDALVSTVLVGRMGGKPLDNSETDSLGAWMDAQPALTAPPPANGDAVARGKLLFEDATVGCGTCHAGPQLSTHQLLDVGTGGTFKVPSLIAVGYRAPYLHDGCAATLQDRFSAPCASGDRHGATSQLSSAQIDDLVSYLESL
jgi:mono/diheme cytochrome c family protein